MASWLTGLKIALPPNMTILGLTDNKGYYTVYSQTEPKATGPLKFNLWTPSPEAELFFTEHGCPVDKLHFGLGLNGNIRTFEVFRHLKEGNMVYPLPQPIRLN